MDKSCSGCGRHIAGQGISAALFLQTGPQAVLQGPTLAPATACRALGVSMIDNNDLPEEDSENNNLPALLRDDTICECA